MQVSVEPTALPPADNSLTSLSWLHNLGVLDLFSSSPDTAPPIPPISPDPPCSEDSSSCSWESSSCCFEEKRDSGSAGESLAAGMSLSPLRKCLLQCTEFKRSPRKFRHDSEKPPFSFTTLVYLAIRYSKKERNTLNDIYRFIRENFKYYRLADPTWKNSIRHNLSLNEFFVKVPCSRGSGETNSSATGGKGSYWRISPEYEPLLTSENEAHILEHNYSKLQFSIPSKLKPHHHHHKRMRGRSYSTSGATSERVSGNKLTRANGRKRTKSEVHAPADPCGLPGDLDWVSLLSSQKVNCVSCPSHSCRPSFGSPVLGPPDLGHIGDPVMCSPLVVPQLLSSSEGDVSVAAAAGISAIPGAGESKGALLEEVVLKQDSPSPLLLPWAEKHSQSPNTHPWAESQETTLYQMRHWLKGPKKHGGSSKGACLYSPDSSWSSSSASTNSMGGYSKTMPMLGGAY